MRNFHQKYRTSWWENNWHRHVWLIVFMVLALLLTGWGFWASSFGVSIGTDRDAEIRDLIDSEHGWNAAKDELVRLQAIIKSNPLSVSNPVSTLANAEQKVQDATIVFERAGFKALNGEMTIISGVLLQVIVVLLLIAVIRAGIRRIPPRKVVLEIEKDRMHWIEKIRAGQALMDEDEVLRFIDDEVADIKHPWNEIIRSHPITDTYRKLMIKCRKAANEEIPWSQISGIFYKMALMCKERGTDDARVWELRIRDQYKQLRRIINHNVMNIAYSSIGGPVAFLFLFILISYGWNATAGPLLGEQLAFWRDPILLIGAAFVANGISRVLGNSFTRWITEKVWNGLDAVFIGAIVGPLSVLAPAIFFLWAISILIGRNTPPFDFMPFLSWVGYEALANLPRTLFVVFFGTWLVIYLVNGLISFLLDRWASAIGQTLDDVVIKTIQLFATLSILAIGIVTCLSLFQVQLREATGADISALLSIVVAIIAAVGGYTSRFAFDSLVSSLLLQIEKPFEIGDRIELLDGRLCDVREVGLRTTVLYNIADASEISIPNSEMVKSSITNTSRLGLSRVALSVWISIPTQIELAQGVLLDISYLEREVDQMRVYNDELTVEEMDKMKVNPSLIREDRTTIELGMERLLRRHKKIEGTTISQIVGGEAIIEQIFHDSGSLMSSSVPYFQVLINIRNLRVNYQRTIDEEKSWLAHCVEKVEENIDVILMQKYRRAIYEIVFTEPTSSVGLNTGSNKKELSNHIRDIALREQIQVDNLIKTLYCLSGSTSIQKRIRQNAVIEVREKIKSYEAKRINLVLQIRNEVAILENYIYVIGEQYPDIRPELDSLGNELTKEPSITTEYSDDGRVKMSLLCYIFNSQRKVEIINKLNTEISIRFTRAGIQFIK